MALDALINAEAHAKLNPVVQPEYTKQADGTFILTVNPFEATVEEGGKKKTVRYALEDVGGLKTTLGTLRAENGELIGRTKAFEGLDAAKAREALTKVEEMKTWSDEKKVQEQIAANAKQLADKHKAEKEPLEALVGKRTTQLDNVLGAQMARACLKAAGATEKGLELLILPVTARIRAKDGPDGERIAVVVDANGNPQVTNRPGSNDPMSVEELVMSFKKDHPGQFAGSGATGSGTPGTGSGGQNGGSNQQVDSSLNPTERLKQLRRAGAGQQS